MPFGFHPAFQLSLLMIFCYCVEMVVFIGKIAVIYGLEFWVFKFILLIFLLNSSA